MRTHSRPGLSTLRTVPLRVLVKLQSRTAYYAKLALLYEEKNGSHHNGNR